MMPPVRFSYSRIWNAWGFNIIRKEKEIPSFKLVIGIYANNSCRRLIIFKSKTRNKPLKILTIYIYNTEIIIIFKELFSSVFSFLNFLHIFAGTTCYHPKGFEQRNSRLFREKFRSPIVIPSFHFYRAAELVSPRLPRQRITSSQELRIQ